MDLYYRDRYWNDHALVVEYLNRRATGTPHPGWMHHLLAQHGGRPFRRALVLNCGNGWVERDLARLGVIEAAVGVDIAPELVAEAAAAAARDGITARYEIADIDRYDIADDVDLVVNHAAGHHITRLDTVFRRIATALPEDGTFVTWDYVGPHRNQYCAAHWEAAHQLNQTLPTAYRSQLVYPSLLGTIDGDPSEAVHSELVLSMLDRYFVVDHLRRLGGAMGYLLITHNAPLLDAPAEISGPIVERILAADEQAITDHPDWNLFAYAIARPRKDVLTDTDSLDRWTAEENDREARAAANGGRYYEPTLLETLTTAARPDVRTALSGLLSSVFRRRRR